MLLRGGRVLRPGAARAEPADVVIDGDRIVAVAPDATHPPDADQLDARGCLVVPGLINAHTHGHTHLVRGLAGRWTLEDLLNQLSPYIGAACRAAVATPYPVNRYAVPVEPQHPSN
jgi:guanine deaminase